MGSSYEEARKKRVQENLKRFQDLGISGLSENLLGVAKSEYASIVKQHPPRIKSKLDLDTLELRRSSRAAKNPAPIYREADEKIHNYQRRTPRRYTFSFVNDADRFHAVKAAEKFMNDLKSGHPAFVKSMVRSHVSGCFWLGLPSGFCKEHLPSQDLRMVLEDEQGVEYDSLYLASRTGLSAGWRGFSLDHGVDDGDALVFELSKPARFKIYIIKAPAPSSLPPSGKKDHPKKKTKKEPSTTSHALEEVVSQKLQREEAALQRSERAAKRHMRS